MFSVCVCARACVCVCVCVCERERETLADMLITPSRFQRQKVSQENGMASITDFPSLWSHLPSAHPYNVTPVQPIGRVHSMYLLAVLTHVVLNALIFLEFTQHALFSNLKDINMVTHLTFINKSLNRNYD